MIVKGLAGRSEFPDGGVPENPMSWDDSRVRVCKLKFLLAGTETHCRGTGSSTSVVCTAFLSPLGGKL